MKNALEEAHKSLQTHIALLRDLKDAPLTEDQIVQANNALTVYAVAYQDALRIASARHITPPSINAADGEAIGIHIMSQNAPWHAHQPTPNQIPGMITTEEAQYYKWIGKFYSGAGACIELGPWLGASTSYIVAGLSKNAAFQGKKLLVYDDFVWRKSWMDSYVDEADQLPNHHDFRPLFDRYARNIANQIEAHKTRFTIYDGNDNVAPLIWSGGKIELLFVDCGRTIEANQCWYSSLSPHFIPGRTLIVMQDWRLHREIPKKWYNQTDLFTQSHSDQLQLLHEVCDGGIATFLFTDPQQK